MEKLEKDKKYFFTLLLGVLIGTFIAIFIYSTIFIFSNNNVSRSFTSMENLSKIECSNDFQNI